VARAEQAKGRAVLVTGSASEIRRARAVAATAGLPPSAVLAGRTGLLDLAALVAAAGRVVCGDTGIAHLATALRTRSVVLFGPIPPAEWGPPSDRAWHRALWAGRRGDPHGGAIDPGLLRISVDAVLGAVETVDSAVPERPAAVGHASSTRS
jgi:ADP-heptose:LPS heptosyltransferase